MVRGEWEEFRVRGKGDWGRGWVRNKLGLG